MPVLSTFRTWLSLRTPRSRTWRSANAFVRRPLLETLEARLPPGDLLGTNGFTPFFGSLAENAALAAARRVWLEQLALAPATEQTAAAAAAAAVTAPALLSVSGTTPAPTTATTTTATTKPAGTDTTYTVGQEWSAAQALGAPAGGGSTFSPAGMPVTSGAPTAGGSGALPPGPAPQSPPVTTQGGPVAGSGPVSPTPPGPVTGPGSPAAGQTLQILGFRTRAGVPITNGYTNDNQPVVYGNADPGCPVAIWIDGVNVFQFTEGAGGQWAVAAPSPLSQGPHTFTASEMSPTGFVTSVAGVTIDTSQPPVSLTGPDFVTRGQAPTFTVQVNMSYPFPIVPVAHIEFDSNHDGQILGSAEENYATVSLNSAGTGSITLPSNLANGTYLIRAWVADVAGNQGGSAFVPFQVDQNAGFLGSEQLLDLAYHVPYGTPVGQGGPVVGGPIASGPSSGGDGTNSGGISAADRKRYFFDTQNRVLTQVRATTPAHVAQLKAGLQSLGMNVVEYNAKQVMLIGYLPVDKILSLPNLPGFSAATAAQRPQQRVGSVTTQGDAVILGPQFRASQGVDGTGVKVGVLSDSVNQFQGGLADSIKTGDLPSDVQVIADDPLGGGTDEGRAMLEIIHDIAPGAALAFATAYATEQDFANDIVALAQAGCLVETDDVGYADEPMFNDGIIAQAVNQVQAAGVFYDSAAGNTSNQGYLAPWTPTNTTVAGLSGEFQTFSNGSPLETFTCPTGQDVVISFEWDSAFLEGGSSLPNFQVPNNLEVDITDAAGSKVLATFNSNGTNTDEAWQFVDFTNNSNSTQLAFVFKLDSGAAPGFVRWVNFNENFDPKALDENGPTIFGHPVAAGGVAVAAIDAQNVPQLEPYSSLGGNLNILFDANGNRLATPDVRAVPQLTAPDDVATSFFIPGQPDPSGKGFDFTGTSAAAPHVAGAAALILQAAPGTAPSDVVNGLETSALDLLAPGFDANTGFGLIQLTDATLVNKVQQFPDDAYENNDTSNAATNFGNLASGQTQHIDATVNIKANGLPDYDWYQWTAQGSSVMVAAQESQGGTLEVHLFTLQGNTLVELSNSTFKVSSGATLAAPVAPGQVVFVEVKGKNTAPGVFQTGVYSLDVSMT